jgi:hypothetical protein
VGFLRRSESWGSVTIIRTLFSVEILKPPEERRPWSLELQTSYLAFVAVQAFLELSSTDDRLAPYQPHRLSRLNSNQLCRRSRLVYIHSTFRQLVSRGLCSSGWSVSDWHCIGKAMGKEKTFCYLIGFELFIPINVNSLSISVALACPFLSRARPRNFRRYGYRHLIPLLSPNVSSCDFCPIRDLAVIMGDCALIFVQLLRYFYKISDFFVVS